MELRLLILPYQTKNCDGGLQWFILSKREFKVFWIHTSTKNGRESCSVKSKTLYTRLWLNYGLLWKWSTDSLLTVAKKVNEVHRRQSLIRSINEQLNFTYSFQPNDILKNTSKCFLSQFAGSTCCIKHMHKFKHFSNWVSQKTNNSLK